MKNFSEINLVPKMTLIFFSLWMSPFSSILFKTSWKSLIKVLNGEVPNFSVFPAFKELQLLKIKHRKTTLKFTPYTLQKMKWNTISKHDSIVNLYNCTQIYLHCGKLSKHFIEVCYMHKIVYILGLCCPVAQPLAMLSTAYLKCC